jgi:hypothetical protein
VSGKKDGKEGREGDEVMEEDIFMHEKKNITTKLHNYNILIALKHPKQGREKEAGFRNEGENENN